MKKCIDYEVDVEQGKPGDGL